MRRADGATGIITTVAGNGSRGFSGDGGPATSAELDAPRGLALDATGNLFIADQSNHRIRRVDAATGIITTIAGNGSAEFSGDGGPATSAGLNRPQDVVLRGDSLYIADSANRRVRRISLSSGAISTFAGTGSLGSGGDGGPAASAQLTLPVGLTADQAGNVWIVDSTAYLIRRVSAHTGIISTVAGNGASAVTPEPVPATVALLHPADMALDTGGDLWSAPGPNASIG
ncbi:MAG: hypothetical protein R2748_11755 [Bryobacterales bacterium]